MIRTNISRSKVTRNKKTIRKSPRKKENIVGKLYRTSRKTKLPIKNPRSIFAKKKPPRPVDIRHAIRLVDNPNFQVARIFSLRQGQAVFRKTDRRHRKLIVVGFYGDRIFLNDLSLAQEIELSPMPDFIELYSHAS